MAKSAVINIVGIDALVKNMNVFVKAVPKATAFALNGSTKKAQTASLRNVRQEWKGLKASSLALYARHNRATVNKLQVEFTFKSGSIPLFEFGARQIGMGVSYKLKGGRKKIKSAFINKSKSGKGEHVLLRTGKERYPLRPLIAVTPTHMFLETKSDDVYIDTFLDHFDNNYRNRLNYILAKG